MRAFALGEFGDPTMGTVQHLPLPAPGEGQVRVRVAAAGVNPADASAVAGYYKDFMPTTFPLVPGWDLAGTVDALGSGVDGLIVGEAVYGQIGRWNVGEGTYAEFALASAGSLARQPDHIDTPFAAALPQVGTAALQLIEAVAPKAGDVVVVIGATGGVGSVLLQLLRAAGAHTIAVTKAANHEYARELGAVETIDYVDLDVAKAVAAGHPEGIAALVDLAGDKILNASLAALVRSGGVVASMGATTEVDALASRGVTVASLTAQVTTDRLNQISSLVASGTIRRPEITLLPLEQAGEALVRVGSHHVRGKLVVGVR